MKTSDQVLAEWVTDQIKFKIGKRKTWNRKDFEVLAAVVAGKTDKMSAFDMLAVGDTVASEMTAMTHALTALREAGPMPTVTGRWLAMYESIEDLERDMRRRKDH